MGKFYQDLRYTCGVSAMNPAPNSQAERFPSRWLNIAAPVLLLVIVIAFFWKVVLTNQYSWLESPDLAWQIVPWFQYQAVQFHQHVFPIWDPYQYAGQTLIGQDNPGLAYPLNWILFSLPLKDGHINIRYLDWYYMLIHYFGALFCYWLCRDLDRRRTASIAAGISFGLGGFIGTTDWPEIINGAIWAPLVFLFLFRALRGVRPRISAALCGLFLGVSWLSGHHVIPMFTSLAVLVVWLYSLVARSEAPMTPSRKRLAVCVSVFLLFTAMAGALQMWPTFAYGRTAVRWVGSQHDPITWKETVPYTVHKRYSLSPRYLPGILIPRYDDGVSPYAGVTALALAGLALTCFWRIREVRLLFSVGLGGLLFALGDSDVFHGILYSTMPMIEKAREPAMAIFLFHFAIALLIGFGMDALADLAHGLTPGALRRLMKVLVVFGSVTFLIVLSVFIANGEKWIGDDGVVVTVFAALALSGLVYRLSRAPGPNRYLPLLVIALYLFELGNNSLYYLPNKDELARNIYLSRLADTKQVADFLRREPQPVRVWTNMEDVPFNFGDWFGIDTLSGYTPSMPFDFYRIEAYTRPGREIYSAAYAIGRKPMFPDQTEVFRDSNGLAVYRNPEVMARVRTVHDAVRVTDSDDARHHLQNPAFDLRTRTFGYTATPLMEQCNGDTVGNLVRRINETSTTVTMKCRGMVIISENDAPGWTAQVDGRKTPVYDAYTVLRGVVVDAGTHNIRMLYRPLSVSAGATATLLAFLAAFGLWLTPWERGETDEAESQ